MIGVPVCQRDPNDDPMLSRGQDSGDYNEQAKAGV